MSGFLHVSVRHLCLVSHVEQNCQCSFWVVMAKKGLIPLSEVGAGEVMNLGNLGKCHSLSSEYSLPLGDLVVRLPAFFVTKKNALCL